MIVEKDYIKGLSSADLKNEWNERGYADYYDSIGRVSGLGWNSMDALINYCNYESEMKDRGLI